MSKKEMKQIKALEEAMAELVAQAKLSARHTSATLLRVATAALVAEQMPREVALIALRESLTQATTLLRVATAALVAEQMPREVALIALRESLTQAIIFFNDERAEREKGNL